MRGASDLLAGLVFAAFGLAAMHIADRDYAMGSATHMGPGNFPAALGVILALFGVFIAARGLGWPRNAATPLVLSLRPLACVVGSMFLFGFLMPRLGLVPALVAMFFASALGGREFRFREVLVLTAVMSAFAVGVFVYLLKLPFALIRGVYLV